MFCMLVQEGVIKMKMGEESLPSPGRCLLPLLAYHEDSKDAGRVRCCLRCWSERKTHAHSMEGSKS